MTEHMSSKNKACHSDVRRFVADEGAVKESGLHEETRSVLHALLFEPISDRGKSEPCFSCRMTENPSNGRQDVSFHLNECALFVRIAARLCKLLNGRHAIFGIFEFGCNPESSAANELIVLLEDNALGYISVDNVNGKIQSLWTQTMLLMDLNKKVDEIWSHVPLQLRLHIDEFDVWVCSNLHVIHVFLHIITVFGFHEIQQLAFVKHLLLRALRRKQSLRW